MCFELASIENMVVERDLIMCYGPYSDVFTHFVGYSICWKQIPLVVRQHGESLNILNSTSAFELWKSE